MMKTALFSPSETLLEKSPEEMGIVHFVGIGGIGMSALARTLHHYGYSVQGSDLNPSTMLEHLNQEGIKTFVGHKENQIDQAHYVVLSSAISADNPEKQGALRKKIPLIKRGELLGAITQNKKTLSITGSHGKTTTTSLTTKLLHTAGMDPLAIAGGIMSDYQSNVLLGKGDFLVAEMDESDGSHQNARSAIGVITNIDLEHMDFYKTEKDLIQSFQIFLDQIDPQGLAVLCADNPLIQKLSVRAPRQVITYGFNHKAHIRLANLRYANHGLVFDVLGPEGKTLKDIRLNLLGDHNALNATAVLAIGLYLNIPEDILREAFASFGGVHRRFKHVGTFGHAAVIDDYAHHPVEIAATLESAKQACKGKIYAVCEPHRYTRLKDHLSQFGATLSKADGVYVMPLYEASEKPIHGISSEALAQNIRHHGKEALTVDKPDNLAEMLEEKLTPDDMVVFMGAGHASSWAHHLAKIG